MTTPFSYKSIFKKIISIICFVTAFLFFNSNYNAQSWSLADTTELKRHSSGSVLLQDGRVLKTGGHMIAGLCYGATIECETFDPLLNSWSFVSSMNAPRNQHTATLLNSGEVLVVGGFCGGATAEKYNPVSDTWTSIPNMNHSRYLHTATLLKDGRVLVIGGKNANQPLVECEIYDPFSNTWSIASSMSLGRYWHTATLLPNNKIMVTGGMHLIGGMPRTEVFDPSTNSWATVQQDPAERVAHCATLLDNGNVLVVGGAIPNTGININTCSLFDYSTQTWLPTGSLNIPRDQSSQVLLPNGKVMSMGGDQGFLIPGGLNSCEIYDPAIGTWSLAPSLSTSGNQRTTVLLADGRVLDAVGYTSPITEIFDYKTGTWSPAPALPIAKTEYSLTMLPTGDVLLAGGATTIPIAGTPTSECKLYNSTTGWVTTGSMLFMHQFYFQVEKYWLLVVQIQTFLKLEVLQLIPANYTILPLVFGLQQET